MAPGFEDARALAETKASPEYWASPPRQTRRRLPSPGEPPAVYVVTFEGKTCLITGAAGNLGRVVAAAFASAGASLVLVDLDDKVLRSAFGHDDERKVLVRADLLDATSVAQAVAAARFPGIDVLCNIAGGFRMGKPVHETPENVWELMLDLNAKSVINTARAVVPKMLAAGRGKIVNIGAVAGSRRQSEHGRLQRGEKRGDPADREHVGGIARQGDQRQLRPAHHHRHAAEPGRHARRRSAALVAPEALADVILFLSSDAARAIHGAAIP